VLQGLGALGGTTVAVQAGIGLGAATTLEAADFASEPGIGRGKKVVILGAGVAGLVAAYELLKRGSGYQCEVVEAAERAGGRSLTLRHGDVLVEQLPSGQSYRDQPGVGTSRQVCALEPASAVGYDRPFLNAGPGRLPSGHVQILELCRQLGVPLQLYVMETRSSLVRGTNGVTFVNRHAVNDFRGWLAERLYRLAPQLTDLTPVQQEALRRLLISYGALGNGTQGELGRYAKNGRYERSTRSGYTTLPAVAPGVSVPPIPLTDLLEAGLDRTQLFQPEDWFWQRTLFEPVGGMDRIIHALAAKVREFGGVIRTGAEVVTIFHQPGPAPWKVLLRGSREPIAADVCISSIPIPLLRGRLANGVPLGTEFRESLDAVMGTATFLAPTCKVGWQARRDLWQEPGPGRVVPIFGGISWTAHAMTQLWYPSSGFTDELGVLTGAYNYGANATAWGQHSPGWRLGQGREGARDLAGPAFADGLGKGLSIAWQNLPFLRGGWAQWQEVQGAVRHYNRLLQGDPSGFHVCGDQLSQLPGWKEGAVASARHVVGRLTSRVYAAAAVDSVPDSRAVVEGWVSGDLE
jgi:monoamine oxidase